MEAIDEWYTLSKRADKKKEAVSGELHLKIQYGDLKLETKEAKDDVKGKGKSTTFTPTSGTSSEASSSEGGHKQLTVSKKWGDQNVKLKNSAAVVIEEDDLPYNSDDEEYEPTRKGPSAAAMDKLNKDQKITLTNKNLEVRYRFLIPYSRL